MRRRIAAAIGAVACFAASVLLFLTAADVRRWQDAFAAGDVRYRAAPAERDLWQPRELAPLAAARRLLEVDDDLAFRHALRALTLARLDRAYASDPNVALRRGDARARLQAIVEDDADARRRSRALALLGVLGFANALAETQNQAAVLQEAIGYFQEAIALDTANAEAKLNLERALQRGRGTEATAPAGGPNPSPGGAGSKGAGAGDPGSGY